MCQTFTTMFCVSELICYRTLGSIAVVIAWLAIPTTLPRYSSYTLPACLKWSAARQSVARYITGNLLYSLVNDWIITVQLCSSCYSGAYSYRQMDDLKNKDNGQRIARHQRRCGGDEVVILEKRTNLCFRFILLHGFWIVEEVRALQCAILITKVSN